MTTGAVRNVVAIACSAVSTTNRSVTVAESSSVDPTAALARAQETREQIGPSHQVVCWDNKSPHLLDSGFEPCRAPVHTNADRDLVSALASDVEALVARVRKLEVQLDKRNSANMEAR